MQAFTTSGEVSWQPGNVQIDDSVSSTHGPPLQLSGAAGPPLLGFGGCFNELGANALFSLDAHQADAVLESLFGNAGCAFSFCRAPIGASDFALSWYSLAERPEDYKLESFSLERDRRLLLPFIKEACAIQPELTLFLSPWSPPEWMKEPRRYNGGSLRAEERVHDAYAEYLLRAVLGFRAEGVDVAQLHVQNEPNSDQKFPSCVWTGAAMRDFIRDHLGPRFAAAGNPCEIWAGTIERGALQGWQPDQLDGDCYHNWLHTILADPRARAFVKGAGYQWAGKGALPQTRAEWPALPVIQTEGECGDGRNSWSYAFYAFDLIWWYLHHGASAYVAWNMVLPPGGASTWGWRQNCLVTVDAGSGDITYNPEFFVMKHLSHFVPRGSRALGLSGSRAGFTLAFEIPEQPVARAGDSPVDSATQPVSHVLVFANPAFEEVCAAVDLPFLQGTISLPPRSLTTLKI